MYTYTDPEGNELLNVALANTEEKLLKSRPRSWTAHAQPRSRERPQACKDYEAKYDNACVWSIDSRVINTTATSFHHPGELFPALEASVSPISFITEHVKDQNYRKEGHGISLVRSFLVGPVDTDKKFVDFLNKPNERTSPGLNGKLGKTLTEFERSFTPASVSDIKCQKEGCSHFVSAKGVAEQPYCMKCLPDIPAEDLEPVPPEGAELMIPVRWSRLADQLLWGFQTSKYVEA